MKWKHHRLLLPFGVSRTGQVELEGEAQSYLQRVLRLRAGDRLELFDGAGQVCEATLLEALPERKGLRLSLGVWQAGLLPPPNFTLLQGVMKGDKMDYLVQKSVELGLTRLVPVECQRSVTKLSGGRASRRRERWQKIADEATRQSGRAECTVIEAPLQLAEALAALPTDLPASEQARWLPWEEQQGVGLRRLLFEEPAAASHCLFIGPEGGLAADEVEQASQCGFRPISLGGRILRTETAGLAVLAAVRASQGELGE